MLLAGAPLPLHADESLSGGRDAAAKSKGSTFILTVRKPRTAKSSVIKKVELVGCWLDQPKIKVNAVDRNGKKVRTKIVRDAGSSLQLLRAQPNQFPIKVKLSFPEKLKREKKRSELWVSSARRCAKSDTACDPTSLTVQRSKLDGPACTVASSFEGAHSLGSLLLNLDESTLHSTSSLLQFVAQGTTLKENSDQSTVFLNGQLLPPSRYRIGPNYFDIFPPFAEGRNEVSVHTEDMLGLALESEAVVWAGSDTLQVVVTDAAGSALSGAEVTLFLPEAPAIRMMAQSSGAGIATFENLPGRTVVVRGVASGGLRGSAGGSGDTGQLTLKLKAFPLTASSVPNNDFSAGLAGWEVGGAPVSLRPHQPDTQSLTHPTGAAGGEENLDLVLSTLGEGPQSVGRSFPVQSQTREVAIRFRFITSEVPGGYFGTQYNDYFQVMLRTESGGGYTEEFGSMNGLGLSAFEFFSGRTAWREISLPITESGDVVQAEVVVANVGDGAYDSQVEVDLIKEQAFAIKEASLFDIDRSTLSYLSTDSHSYFDGTTRVLGKVVLTGEKDDRPRDIQLEILRGASVAGVFDLTGDAVDALEVDFGDDEKIEVTSPTHLYDLPSAVGAALASSTNESFSLRLRARSTKYPEQFAEKTLASVEKLIRYAGANRYGQRDTAMGGDDWVKPSVESVVAGLAGVTWGDFSNMNGGPFSPHASHRSGNSIDGWFSGYNARNAATAATLIGLLNSSNGWQIGTVFVAYTKTAADPFWAAIQNVTLADGRAAADVIRPEPNHTTHFHIEVAD